jgi:hypothetical protein
MKIFVVQALGFKFARVSLLGKKESLSAIIDGRCQLYEGNLTKGKASYNRPP